jgi:hypothetical protein
MAKITRLYADELEAGDTLVVKEGSIRKFYHICEIQIRGRDIKVVYNTRFDTEEVMLDADDRVRIRE